MFSRCGTIPWDRGYVNLALVELAEERAFSLPQGRALVPGYDVFYLANRKRHVCGLDVSPTVIEEAKGVYDLVYDYT
ncbi:hypothetical protein BC938DRAFT_474930, partial [Jimgerdemannia flammicorona]